MPNDAYYDERWALEYSWKRPPNEERVNLVVAAALQAVHDRPQCHVADIGCGNGWILAALRQRSRVALVLYGLEPSAAGAANAKDVVPDATIWHGTLESVSVDRQFDLVICSEVIEHVEDQNEFIARLARLTKPAGTLILTTPNGRFRKTYFDHYSDRLTPQPVEQWLTIEDLTALCGTLFETVSNTTFDLSYFYDRHPVCRCGLRLLSRVRGGWTVWNRLVESPLLRVFASGVYHLVVMRRTAVLPTTKSQLSLPCARGTVNA